MNERNDREDPRSDAVGNGGQVALRWARSADEERVSTLSEAQAAMASAGQVIRGYVSLQGFTFTFTLTVTFTPAIVWLVE
jgi:hypothetical protein